MTLISKAKLNSKSWHYPISLRFNNQKKQYEKILKMDWSEPSGNHGASSDFPN
jgi:hypothetical protein